jgi:ankyrin repeat protein
MKNSEILFNAIDNDNNKLSEMLITLGFDVNKRTQKNRCELLPHDTPLHHAVLKKNKQIISLLIQKGADVNAKDDYNDTPLNFAIELNDIEITEILLDNGAVINPKDVDRNIPLHTAVQNKNNLGMIKFLVRKGADIKAIDKNENSVLHIASFFGNTEAIKYFIYLDLDLNIKDNKGETPLFKALNYSLRDDSKTKNCFDFVEFLITLGADINIQDKDGNTPLYYATKNALDFKLYQPLITLLKYKADSNIKNNIGFTPLDLAKGRGTTVKFENSNIILDIFKKYTKKKHEQS